MRSKHGAGRLAALSLLLGCGRGSSACSYGLPQVGARTIADACGFERKACWEIAIAVSELAATIVAHAGQGTVCLRVCDEPVRLVIIAEDCGPGFSDVDETLRQYAGREADMLAAKTPATRRASLSIGLTAVSRLMDTVDLGNSECGGNRFIAVRYREPEAPLERRPHA